MDRQATVDWFKQLSGRGSQLDQVVIEVRLRCHRSVTFYAWMAEADTAIHKTFHLNHPIRSQWCTTTKALVTRSHGTYVIGNPAIGVFEGAARLVSSDHFDSLIETIQARTTAELLTQAEHLLGQKYLVASAVISGGALETHLKHLCEKCGLSIQGDGSISKYDDAIAQARNTNTAAVYSATDSKRVKAWGGHRNDAAHSPGSFEASKEAVEQMIDGIRELIERTNR